jgi:hypothetical protein
MKNTYTCIITGENKYIAPSIAAKKIAKFSSEVEFRKHYIVPQVASLLRKGQTVSEIRSSCGAEDLPEIDPHVLTRLKLLRKKPGQRAQQAEEKLERERYLNSQEFKDKVRERENRNVNMSYRDWVERYTGTGRERGGTCVRPDIFLTWNNKACDGCQCYEFCMCYGKRLSHEKRKPKKR